MSSKELDPVRRRSLTPAKPPTVLLKALLLVEMIVIKETTSPISLWQIRCRCLTVRKISRVPNTILLPTISSAIDLTSPRAATSFLTRFTVLVSTCPSGTSISHCRLHSRCYLLFCCRSFNFLISSLFSSRRSQPTPIILWFIAY